jgi:hypothetical protein
VPRGATPFLGEKKGFGSLMKKHYFEHDYSARNDQKILQLRYKHGAGGYGIFWMLLETMAEDSTGYIQASDIGGLSLCYGVAIGGLSDVLKTCVEIGLFKQCEHGNYYSERMLFHRKEMDNFSLQGRKGAQIRWGNRGANAGANTPPNTPCNAIRVKDSIVNETKEKKTDWSANLIKVIEAGPQEWMTIYQAAGHYAQKAWDDLWKLPDRPSMETVLSTARCFAAHCKENETVGGYVKKPENWIRDGGWKTDWQKMPKKTTNQIPGREYNPL